VELKEAEIVRQGDIVTLAGIEDVQIGDTICTKENPKALPRISVDEPTLSMLFSVNTSPFTGREGKIVQSRKIYERLIKETLLNVAIQVETTQNSNAFIVKGRGEFQMEIFIETMIREGFELNVGAPKIIYKQVNGRLFEPIEYLFIDCSEDSIGIITDKLSKRKGKMEKLINFSSHRVRMEFTIPSRSLIGYRNEFIIDTGGTGELNSYLKGYEEYRGNFSKRVSGSLVADRQGKAVTYALDNLSPRGTMFIVPGDQVYEGMIVGEHKKDSDLSINPCKEKHLTNMRSSTSDLMRILPAARKMTLGQAIGFIKEDEMVEITPLSVRMRKSLLSGVARNRFRAEQSRVAM
jgi:GTP-binding protein